MVRSRILSSASQGLINIFQKSYHMIHMLKNMSLESFLRPSRRVSFERSKRIKRDGTVRRPNMSNLAIPSNRNSRGENIG